MSAVVIPLRRGHGPNNRGVACQEPSSDPPARGGAAGPENPLAAASMPPDGDPTADPDRDPDLRWLGWLLMALAWVPFGLAAWMIRTFGGEAWPWLAR